MLPLVQLSTIRANLSGSSRAMSCLTLFVSKCVCFSKVVTVIFSRQEYFLVSSFSTNTKGFRSVQITQSNRKYSPIFCNACIESQVPCFDIGVLFSRVLVWTVRSDLPVSSSISCHLHISLLSIFVKYLRQVDFKSATVLISTWKAGKSFCKNHLFQLLSSRQSINSSLGTAQSIIIA